MRGGAHVDDIKRLLHDQRGVFLLHCRAWETYVDKVDEGIAHT
jgi:hypothetical protein